MVKDIVTEVYKDAVSVPGADCSDALRLCSLQSCAGLSLGKRARRNEMETAHGACVLP